MTGNTQKIVGVGALIIGLFCIIVILVRSGSSLAETPPGHTIDLGSEQSASSSVKSATTTDKLGEVDFTDQGTGLKAKVYLPLSLGRWGVENPWRDATTSIVVDASQPQVYVKVFLQSSDHPQFYGLVRTIPDLKGTACTTFIKKVGAASGLELKQSLIRKVQNFPEDQILFSEFYDPKGNRVVESKILCNSKFGIELMIVSPDDPVYKNALNEMIADAVLTIPVTSSGYKGSLPR